MTLLNPYLERRSNSETEKLCSKPPSAALVKDGVARTLFRMAVPMLAGTFAMTAYNLTDTWFVSRLGTLPLAAMGFSFPVIMLMRCLTGGLGAGVTPLVSHAIGRSAHGDAARVVTHGMALTVVVSLFLSVAGYFSIDFVFARLGADADARALVGEYMRTWYLGAVFMSLPMMGNGILISVGDSKSAARFMMLGTLLNVILDPIMIFGWLGFPAMGIRGAALATVIAQAVATAWLLRLLRVKHRLLVFRKWKGSDYMVSLKRILAFGIPGILTMILMPVSSAVITRLLGRFGNEAVAAAGAAGRIEMLAFVIPMALGMSLTPFISQNYGAGCIDRIREAMKLGTRFAFFYGVGVAALFFIGADELAGLFSEDPRVVTVLVDYIRIISFGYGMMEVHRYCGFALTGLHKPAQTTLLNALRVLVFLVPLSYLGAGLMGIRGIFAGRLVADIAAGVVGLFWAGRAMRAVSRLNRVEKMGSSAKAMGR